MTPPDGATGLGGKFRHPTITADGQPRAGVRLDRLATLWFNTGTLCNLACENCYIESTPRNDRLVYLSHAEVCAFLDEIEREKLGTEEIGLTGGEPFMNPDIIAILTEALARGFSVLVLTNAMRPMQRHADALQALNEAYGARLTVRVSVDHHDRALHEEERGPRSWTPMMDGLKWLSDHGFNLAVAGRTRWGADEAALRLGFADLFARNRIGVDAHDPAALVLFPEMDERAEVPEITTDCWDLLGVNPSDMMCASARMVVRRKGDTAPVVLACTLLAYEPEFELGRTLQEASRSVQLNHPHCAKFCVLGGGSCSA